MLTACLRVVAAVTNSGVSGNKCLLVSTDDNEDAFGTKYSRMDQVKFAEDSLYQSF